ncbi:MAG: tetratricopeptide repeat protein [Chloroflexota bacterium]
MKNRLAILMGLGFWLVACTEPSPRPPEANTPTTTGSGLILLAAEGEVQVRRAGSTDFVPATTGMVLFTNDELSLGPTARAVIQCEDMTTWYASPATTTTIAGKCPLARNDVNLLAISQGQVRVRRLGRLEFSLATNGTIVQRGDEVQAEANAVATMICNDLSTPVVPTERPVNVADVCPPGEEEILSTLSGGQQNRGGTDPLIPYVISPRMTRLLTNQPTLRWNEVVGATSYTLRIQGQDFEWETETDQTALLYPGEPLLEAGVVYLLSVEAANGRSSEEEGTARLGFVILTEAEAATVQAAVAQLAAANLPVEALTLARAHLYASYGLTAEALEELEALAQGGSQTPAVYRLLGDLHRQIGLPLLAEDDYLQAAPLAEAAGDLEAQAQAQVGAGEVYLTLGNREEAIRWLTRGRQAYESLGDGRQVAALTARLEELQP